MDYSHESLEYFDQEANQKIVPYVIEPSVGLDRLILAILCDSYNEEVVKFMKSVKETHISDEDKTESIQCITQTYRDLCIQTCPNENELCDIAIDLCYTNDKSKQFAWSMCGHTIIQNLLRKNNNEIIYLTESEEGTVKYCGKKFKIEKKKVKENGTDNE